jgi:hypothetical protein
MTTAKPRPPLAAGETRTYPVLPLRDIVVFPSLREKLTLLMPPSLFYRWRIAEEAARASQNLPSSTS